MISRRSFLKQSSLATAGTMLVPNFLKALENPSGQQNDHGKILVVVQLSGGNDGLNTIVPYRNDLYYSNRPTLAISPEKVLKGNDELGFHPSLSKLKALYDRGYVTVLNNVGYPNPDRSHFRSMDIWQTASDARHYLSTGWLGRYLDASCQHCAIAHQAIEIDDTLSLALKGESIKGMAIKDPKKIYQVMHHPFVQDISKQQANPQDNSALHYLYKTLAETVSSTDYIYSRTGIAVNTGVYPENEFAARLKTIAGLILAGVQTKVYYVSLSGFDTHVKQTGQHERLLTLYADAVHAFVSDLEKNNRMEDVLIMTFSEFGRRVSENASGGTDHGTANNLFVIGKQLKTPGFLNDTPDLIRLDQGDLIYKVDFRSVYATLLDKWLDTSHTSVLGRPFGLLNFI